MGVPQMRARGPATPPAYAASSSAFLATLAGLLAAAAALLARHWRRGPLLALLGGAAFLMFLPLSAAVLASGNVSGIASSIHAAVTAPLHAWAFASGAGARPPPSKLFSSAINLWGLPAAGVWDTAYSCPAREAANLSAPPCAAYPVDVLLLEFQQRAVGAPLTLGTPPCRARASAGASARLVGPAGWGPGACLPLGVPHRFTLLARDGEGLPACAGGDYFEAQLEGSAFRYRPRFSDGGNGSYALTILLPDEEALVGAAQLSVTQLFPQFDGLTLSATFSARPHKPAALPPTTLNFSRHGQCGAQGAASAAPPPSILLPPTRSCTAVDFMAEPFWHGMWLSADRARAAFTGDAADAANLRFVYRLHACRFHVFSRAAARRCVDGAWLFGSGDSTMPDFERTLLEDVLGVDLAGWHGLGSECNLKQQPLGRSNDIAGWGGPFARRGEAWPDNASAPAFSFRASNVFNGAPDVCGNLKGILSLEDPAFRAKHMPLLNSSRPPDLLLIQSGAHDSWAFSQSPYAMHAFKGSALGLALPFYDALRAAASHRSGGCQPRRIWRMNQAPAGAQHRVALGNPQKHELFNRIMAELLEADDAARVKGGAMRGGAWRAPKRAGSGSCGRPFSGEASPWGFLDYFDLTTPWHFDILHSDGNHYGRPGHNMVEVMLAHVLLNGLCGASE